MKKKVFWKVMPAFVTALAVLTLAGCATSMQDRQVTREELAGMNMLGSVNANLTMTGAMIPTPYGTIFAGPTDDKVKALAYTRLIEEARKKFEGEVDIVNITISRNGRNGNNYLYSSSGSVISTYSAADRASERLGGITGQILNAFRGNNNATIAILDFVNANDRRSVLGRYLVEQISNYFFQNSNLKIVERAQISRIANEQNFNMSGSVSDETAVRIGRMTGAAAVTLGTLTRMGDSISVNIKIVDTETGSLLSSGSTTIQGADYIELYNQYLD